MTHKQLFKDGLNGVCIKKYIKRNALTSVDGQTVHLVLSIRALNRDVTSLRHREARAVCAQKPGASLANNIINGCYLRIKGYTLWVDNIVNGA